MTYSATINPKLPTKKTYNGTTTLRIYADYTKVRPSPGRKST